MLIYDYGYSDGFDGPGNRLIYYLKGCNLHCAWCGAPESISPVPQLLNYPGRQVRAGQTVSPAEILKKALSARDFISGVTFGGGEPTLQAEELMECLALLRENGIHTAVESNASTKSYFKVVPAADFVFSDLKSLEPEKYPAYLGCPEKILQRICENLRFAAENAREFVLRIPVVAGVNDDRKARAVMADFCGELSELCPDGKLNVQLLRQHHLAEPKYQALGIPSPFASVTPPPRMLLEEFAQQLKLSSPGVNVQVFG